VFKIENIIRQHLQTLTPYSTARDDYKGKEGVFLDANENPLGSSTSQDYNRYPDPHQWAAKEKIAVIKGVQPNQIFLGNGSDEAIDLLVRACCEPKEDNIIIMPPTYGMYKVCADIQNVEVISVPLTTDFQINTEATFAAITQNTKLVWICSPNNPSGNLLEKAQIYQILENFDGFVVVDEAYIDFANTESFTKDLPKYKNLVVLQTFSKAWGLAGLRLGMAFADESLIGILNKIKYPYNINIITQKILVEALENEEKKNEMVAIILKKRFQLFKDLVELEMVQHIYPSDSNMLLVKFKDAKATFEYLLAEKIIVRDRSNVKLCEGCLRITVGTKNENKRLIEALKNFQ
jgi:histidinol-phosphate aminotransferase